MGIYMVDREYPEVTLDQLVSTQRALIDMSRRFTARGEHISYLRSTYLPSESRCLCWFEALDSRTVEELNEVARAPFLRVIEVVELAPDQL